MHELSIAHALVGAVTDAVADAPGRVTEVHVRVGVLSGVVPEALEFAYDVAADGTRLAGSRLVVVSCPVVVHCADCGTTGALPDRWVFACPACATPTGDVRGGHELDISHVVLDDVVLDDDALADDAVSEATPQPHADSAPDDARRSTPAGVPA